MDIPLNNDRYYCCDICNKEYSSYKSLWNHNKKFHYNNVLKSSDNGQKCSENVLKSSDNIKKYYCRKCNKNFFNVKTRWSHEQKCKENKINDNKLNILEKTILQLQQQIQTIVKEKGKVHHKTLQKINKQVINTINNTNNNNTNNGIIINNTFVKFGDVSYEKQLLSILNKQYMSLEEGINKTHFNEKLSEYSNVFITNFKDSLAYIFNGNGFITVKKHDMLNEIMDTHITEINLSYEKMKDKLIPKHADRIQKFLEKLNDIDTKYKDPDNDRVYSNYKAYKMDAIKLAIYNNSDKKKLEALKNIKLIEKIDVDSEDSDFEL